MPWFRSWLAAGRSAAPWISIAVLGSTACDRERAREHEHEHAPGGVVSARHHDADEHGHERLPELLTVSPKVVESAGIKSERVTKVALPEALTLPGEVSADPDRLARISSPTAGRIEQVLFREGEAVKKGQALVVIRVPEIARARASHFGSQARAKAARANAERLRALFRENVGTEQAALDAEAEAEALELESRSAKEELGALGAGTSGSFSVTLRSPLAGVVVARNAIVGQPAPADQTLGTVADLREVWFLARVFEKDLGQLRVGAMAEVHLNAYADEHFPGVVEYIGQQIDPVARTVNARVRLQNKGDLLRLGLFGTCQIAIESKESGGPKLVVARSSVTDVGGKNVVFVRQGSDKFELHEVTLGREALGRVEVLAGLREGEEIVSDGVFTLKSMVLKGSFAEDHH